MNYEMGSQDKAEKITAGMTAIIVFSPRRCILWSKIILATTVSRAGAGGCALSDGDLWETGLPYFL